MTTEADEALHQEELPLQETTPPEDLRNEDSPEGEKSSATDRIKEAQRKMHEATQKAAEYERKLAEVNGKVEALLAMQGGKEEPKADNPFEFLDSPEFVESLYDDPKNAVKALKNIIGVFGQTLRAQDESFNSRLNEKFNVLNPEYRAVKGVVDELRKNPKLANLPEDYLVEIAKETAKTKEDDGYRGSIPTQGRRVPSKKEDEEREAGISFFMKKLGYDRYGKE